jgi:hypothetical protein
VSAPVLPPAFTDMLRGPSSAPPPAARPCVAPPVDDRFELLRAFVLDDINGYKVHSARLLASRAALGDREAWSAVARDMSGPGRGHASDVAEALGRGDLDAAVAEAARVCGDLDADGRPDGERWLREMRDVVAAKGGAR